ncbi:MAG: hypothetical protein MZW92_41005 [Comamonadaceae bacterium]|nr:hypothetical protein [Comamonadaceae bacterium]
MPVMLVLDLTFAALLGVRNRAPDRARRAAAPGALPARRHGAGRGHARTCRRTACC